MPLPLRLSVQNASPAKSNAAFPLLPQKSIPLLPAEPEESVRLPPLPPAAGGAVIINTERKHRYMKRTDLVALQKKLGIVPSKKLGQNFLVDEQFSQWIVRSCDVKEKENILEVGPGFGALTVPLLATGANLIAIEFDRKIAAHLRETLVPKGLTLVEGDACKVDVESLFNGETFRVISNLPYSAGSVFIANMLTLANPPKEMCVMLQKEVAERFAAEVGSHDYGSYTVRLQAMYKVEMLRIVPPDVFLPEPEIDSAVIRLTLREDHPDRLLFKKFSTLVKSSFAHRRKKMFKQAAAVFGKEEIAAAMEKAGVDPDIRAEKVTLAQFLLMAKTLM